jgi:hypothetical protein
MTVIATGHIPTCTWIRKTNNPSFITIESQFNSCLIFSHNFLHHFIIFLIFQKQKLTATDLTALISFLLSIFFNILLTWVSNKFDLYLMSLIHIPTKHKAIINLSYFQQYFSYIVVFYFTVGGWKLKTLKKTISLLQAIDKLYHKILYSVHLVIWRSWTSVVICRLYRKIKLKLPFLHYQDGCKEISKM